MLSLSLQRKVRIAPTQMHVKEEHVIVPQRPCSLRPKGYFSQPLAASQLPHDAALPTHRLAVASSAPDASGPDGSDLVVWLLRTLHRAPSTALGCKRDDIAEARLGGLAADVAALPCVSSDGRTPTQLSARASPTS